MGAIRRSRSVALAIALALLAPLLGAAPVYGASSSFTGGATDTVLFVPNDHTPIGFRFKAPAASGLAASTQYNVKVRFTVGTSPSPDTNRGMTWNGTTHEWVPDLGGSNWDDFPVITTASDGSITEGWLFAKFADETASGDYHVMVSLSEVGNIGAINSSVVPTVTVMAMESEGAWVHNSTAVSGTLAGRRSECTSETSSSVIYALGKTELDLVDSDSNRIVDDEDYGPAGAAGDFRHAVPVGMTFNMLLIKTTTYASAQKITVPDTDIALNAADMVAPTAPASLLVTAGSYKNTLSWGAATDGGGSGIAGYRVYRWTASPSDAYTMPREVVTSTVPAVTSFEDTDVDRGVQYFYEVRAIDASTNVGPRSESGSGIPFGEPTTERTFGSDRYATALAISAATFAPSSVTTAVVATGKDFPDALSASGLAGAYSSPVLLVGNSVTASLTAELDRLGVTDVVIIGGEKAVSASIATALDADYTVDRVFGADRYATAAAVAERIVQVTGGNHDAFFARGDNFADALAVSPFAYGQTTPVLLVRTGSVPSATSGAISSLGITSGVIAGSTSAVSAGVMTTLNGMLSGTIERVGGPTRYDTARAVADFGVDMGWGDYSYVGLATGLNYPDALGGCAATSQNGGVLLLTAPTALSAPAASAITANKATIDVVEFYGSARALSESVFDAVELLLQ